MIEEPTPQKTPLSALGEFGLIQRLTEAISLKNPTSVLGVGDDAAVLDFGPIPKYWSAKTSCWKGCILIFRIRPSSIWAIRQRPSICPTYAP